MVSSERLGQNHEGMKSDGETGHQSFRQSCWRLIVRLLTASPLFIYVGWRQYS